MHPAECVLAHDVHLAAHNVRSNTLAVPAVDFQLSLESEGVGSAYPDQPLAATADETVGNVLQLLRAQRTGAVVICEGSKLVGIFTERDALKLMASGADLSAPVRDVMSSPPATIASTPPSARRSAMMAEGGYRHLPIVDQDQQADRRVGRPRHRPLSGGPFSGNRVQPAARSEGGTARARRSLTVTASNGCNHCRPAKTSNNNE